MSSRQSIAYRRPGREHLVVTHRYMWPHNLPYAYMLKDIVEAAVPLFDRVSVVTVRPTNGADAEQQRRWAETCAVDLNRLGLPDVRRRGRAAKVATHVAYQLWVCWRLLRLRASVTWVASTPPVIAGWSVRAVSRLTRGRYVYHCQDIHPEALLLEWSRRLRPVARLGIGIDRRTVASSAATITLSNDMRGTLVGRGGAEERDLHVIPNFYVDLGVDDGAADQSRSDSSLPTTFDVIFAGGIGRFQGLDRLIDMAAAISPSEGVRFLVVGDGPERRRLERRANNLSHIEFVGQQDRIATHLAIRRASCGLVSLLPGVTRVAYPSKVVDYQSLGLPVFAIIDPNSDLAAEVTAQHYGHVCLATDGSGMADELRQFRKRLAAAPPTRQVLAEGARQRVSKSVVVPRLVEVLEEVAR